MVRNIIKCALFLHFAFGFYMYSNSLIFNQTSDLYAEYLFNVDYYVRLGADYIKNDYIGMERFEETY